VDFTIVNVALPTIGRKLHFPESDLQWVVTAYGLTYAGFVLLGGRAADLLGRRRLLEAGLVVFTSASLGGGLATSDTFLIAMRGIQGLGAALVLPAALSIVTNLFPEGPERNKALGLWGGIGAFGGTVGLLAGGILTTYIGWQYIFFFNVPVGAAALVLAPKVIPESRIGSARRRYDPFGAVTITAALLVLVYAVSQAPQAGWATTQTAAMLAAGAGLLAMFFVIETKAAAPLLPLPLLRMRSVAGSNAVGFLLGASFITGRRAVVVGCGQGADAGYVAGLGFHRRVRHRRDRHQARPAALPRFGRAGPDGRPARPARRMVACMPRPGRGHHHRAGAAGPAPASGHRERGRLAAPVGRYSPSRQSARSMSAPRRWARGRSAGPMSRPSGPTASSRSASAWPPTRRARRTSTG